MGREIKRVALDFEWPMDQVWEGFFEEEPIEPPVGEGWQVWETVSEGSPVTPVFVTSTELVDYLVEGGDSACRQWGGSPPSRKAALNFVEQGFCMSMTIQDGVIKQGINSCE